MDILPTIKNNKIKIREEDHNYYFFISPETSRPHFINETCYNLIKMSDGKTTLNEILEIYYERYPGMDRDKIYKDIVMGFSILTLINIIEFKDGVLPSIGDDNKIRSLNIQDCLQAGAFVQDSFKDATYKGTRYINYLGNQNYASFFIWNRQNHGRELFFGYFQPECRALMSLIPVGNLYYLALFIAESWDIGLALHSEVAKHFASHGVKYFKMKFEDELLCQESKAFYTELGYTLEATLLEESKDGSAIEIWTKSLLNLGES